MNPDSGERGVGPMAAGASTMLNRTYTLVNGTSSIREPSSQMFHHYCWGNSSGNDNDTDIVSVYKQGKLFK